MLNNYVSGLSFPTLLITVLQATVTHQSGLHTSGDTDWPPAAATWCKEPRANYNYSSIQTKGRNHRIKNKASAHKKKTQNVSHSSVCSWFLILILTSRLLSSSSSHLSAQSVQKVPDALLH